MPVIIGEKREGEVRSRMTNGQVTFEQDFMFTVETSNRYVSRETILNQTPGLPRVNLTTIGSMTCKSVTLRQHKQRATRWDGTCTFSSNVIEGTTPSTPQQGNPVTWIPYGKVVFEPYEEVIKKDLDGKAWVNSAGVPFQNGLIRPRRIAAVQFTQFEALGSADLDEIMDRSDTINNIQFLKKPKYSLLLQVDEADVGLFFGQRCWRVVYTLRYKRFPETEDPGGPDELKGHWYTQQADAGYTYLEGNVAQVPGQHYYTGDDEVSFLTTAQIPTVKFLKNGEPSPNNEPNFLAFRNMEETDFSFLRIRNY